LIVEHNFKSLSSLLLGDKVFRYDAVLCQWVADRSSHKSR